MASYVQPAMRKQSKSRVNQQRLPVPPIELRPPHCHQASTPEYPQSELGTFSFAQSTFLDPEDILTEATSNREVEYPTGSIVDLDESIMIKPQTTLTAYNGSKPEKYILVNEAPERYTCLICSALQEQAVLVSCCGQHFCDSCLKKWFRKQGKRCPHCRETRITHLLNKERIRDINELQVFCSNKSNGCTWEGNLGDEDTHLQTKCECVQVDCPQKCKMKLLRKELSKHLEDSCLCRKYDCEHCGTRGTFHSITGECGEYGPCDLHGDGHYSECESFPLECPNECSEIIKRGDIFSHREICPLEPVECSFSEVGCTEKVLRKDLDQHVADSDHQHLILLMEAFKKLKIDLEQSRQEVKELKENLSLQRKYPIFGSQTIYPVAWESCPMTPKDIQCCFDV